MDLSFLQKPRLKSLLPSTLKTLLAAAIGLSLFMLANSGYLLLNRGADALHLRYFAAGETSLPALFQIMVLSHTGVGLLLAALMLGFAILHLPAVWQRKEWPSLLSGGLFVLAGLLLSITGLFILTAAASEANAWAWWTHVLLAAGSVFGYAVHRKLSYARPQPGQYRKYWTAAGAVVLALVIVHGFSKRDIILTEAARAAREQGLNGGPGAGDRKLVPYLLPPFSESGFAPAGYVPPASPFFPSAATTASGGFAPSKMITRGETGSPDTLRKEMEAFGFVRKKRIGAENCNRCHPDIVEQWAGSAHRFSSFNNPFYEATVNLMRETAGDSNPWLAAHLESVPADSARIGNVKSKWCGGCHDPALMLAGKMTQAIDRNSADAQAGLTCLACHLIDKTHNISGNGNYNLVDLQEDPYLFPDAGKASTGAFLHDAIVKAKPAVHKRRMLKPFFRTSEYCAACHKVSLIEPVNNYRWLRGQDEYDNWHDSGVAKNASRTFYLPDGERYCQDCHMPLEAAPLGDVAAKFGYVRSHRFVAANTALPFLRGDAYMLQRIETFLQNEKLRVDIFALRPERRHTPVMALNRRQTAVAPGEKITIDVVVRNKGVGHTFPGGTTDSNEGWLEFSVLDSDGTPLAISGALDENGHLDPMAHVFNALLLDKKGRPILRRDAHNAHVTVYANVIQPGTADIAHFELIVPRRLAGRSLKLRARLLWRKFNRAYSEFAYRVNAQGFPRFAVPPVLPITEIAADEITLPVRSRGENGDADTADVRAEDWERFNDYGIGLLLEGDTRTAALAFAQVAKLQPRSIEGPLNQAKTAVQDGNIEKAYRFLRRCEEIFPGNARSAWTWAVALQEDGRYEKAADAYQHVLARFPKDRAAWRNLGRTYFLNMQHQKAIDAFEKTLEIDPEDRVSWYHLMLCYRALGMATEAARAETAYTYYQIDESAQEMTRAYKIKHAGANLMAQQIRTHKLELK